MRHKPCQLLLGYRASLMTSLACCLQREAAALSQQLQAAAVSHAGEVHELQLAALETREQHAETRAAAALELAAAECACVQLAAGTFEDETFLMLKRTLGKHRNLALAAAHRCCCAMGCG